MIFGAILFVIGLVVTLGGKFLPFGRLPGESWLAGPTSHSTFRRDEHPSEHSPYRYSVVLSATVASGGPLAENLAIPNSRIKAMDLSYRFHESASFFNGRLVGSPERSGL